MSKSCVLKHVRKPHISVLKLQMKIRRNRSRWDDYLVAAADMLQRTSTEYAPWHIIPSNDKNAARLEILRTILKQLKAE